MVAPATPRDGALSPAWGSAGWGKGATEPAQRSQGRRREGREWFLKLTEIPPQLAAAGGAARAAFWGSAVSASLLAGDSYFGALTLLWPPPAPCRQRSGLCGAWGGGSGSACPRLATAGAGPGLATLEPPPRRPCARRQARDLGRLGSPGATTSIWQKAGRALLSQGHFPSLWPFSRHGSWAARGVRGAGNQCQAWFHT